MAGSIMRAAVRMYGAAGLLLLNTVVVLILLNVALLGIYHVKDSFTARRVAAMPRLFNDDGSPVDAGNLTSHQLEWFDFNACREAGERYAAEVLDDFARLTAMGFVYQPWVQFSEPAFRGKRVSVELDVLGFPVRRTVSVAVPPDRLDTVHVFVFGGSTTFGYHVADEDTWPSQLARVLNDKAGDEGTSRRVQVTNYGRGYFNPSQEFALFVDLLKTGYRPALAIFMDGVNIGRAVDVPDFSPKVTAAVAAAQKPPSLWQALGYAYRALPVARAGDAVQARLRRAGLVSPTEPIPEDPRGWGSQYVETAARRFAVARALTRDVGRRFGVDVRFFLQPNAMVNYPTELYRRPLSPRLLAGRERAREINNLIRAQDGVIDLSNLFEKWGHRKAVVDYLHYSPAFSRFLAEEVAQHIDVRALRRNERLIEPDAATGQPREAQRVARS